MLKVLGGRTVLLLVGGMLFTAGWVVGQEGATTQKTTLHAAAWTAVDGFAQKDLDNFRNETAKLVGKVPGLRRVWLGQLREPVTINGTKRTHGIVLEFDDVKSKQDYITINRPEPWFTQVFGKARIPGSSAFDLVGDSNFGQ